MRVVLVGAMGFVGRSAAGLLAARPEVSELLLVDYVVREAKKFAKRLSPKCRWAMADAGRRPELARLLDGAAAAVNAAGPCREYEKETLLCCAGAKVPVASIGDGTLSGPDAREVHDAFRRAGVGAVTGCGMLPGFADLLSEHFLPGGGGRGEPGNRGAGRYLLVSPDRFGGYTFFRRLSCLPPDPTPAPPGAPEGRYLQEGEAEWIGVAAGRPARFEAAMAATLLRAGAVGRELSAAFRFWRRRSLAGPAGSPAAVAGAFAPSAEGFRFAKAEDPSGSLAAALLVHAAMRLSGPGNGKGLLRLPGLVGREEALELAVSAGAAIQTGTVPG